MTTEMYYALKDHINELQDYELVSLWNERCEELRYTEDMIYPMCEFEMLCGDSFREIYAHIDNYFDLNADYFYIDGMGFYHSLDSCRLWADSPVDIDELITWCYENEMWYDELEEFYNKEENDDDED